MNGLTAWKKVMLGMVTGALWGWGIAVQASEVVTVKEPWVGATVVGQTATGAFMKIFAKERVKLVGGSSPVAGVVEIHEMAMEKDVMKMRAIAALPIGAGETVELKPGGYHVMLIQLARPIKVGEQVPLRLQFERRDGTRFEVEVVGEGRKVGGMTGEGHNKGGGH
ncbi:MAG: copper chaperone PCu(A)C [Hydrogenophilus sp.]|nr:copper chaperone PCu(A)C [Hydrogenophilus sp.]